MTTKTVAVSYVSELEVYENDGWSVTEVAVAKNQYTTTIIAVLKRTRIEE